MDALRKSIGVLIIVFIGIPVLLGVIWAVGVTKAVVSTDFLSDLPQEIIEKVPDMIDEVLEEVDREDLVEDPNSRAWVRAVAQAKTSPKELLGKIGFLDWMENELSASLGLMGEMLRGEKPVRQIVLNLRPLKEALRHEAIKDYLIELLKSLPTCDQDQLEDWQAAALNPRDLEELPACRPADLDLETSAKAISFVREREIEDIPDEVILLENARAFPRGVNMLKTIVAFTYLLFLVPAFFIVLASVIGGTGKGGIFRWMGTATLVGGVIAYAFSSLLKNGVPWVVGIAPEAQGITPFEELMVGKAGDIGMVVVERILSGVNSVAGVVCIIGVVLFALSYLLGSSGRKTETPPAKTPPPRQPQPQPPAKEPVIEAQFIKEESAPGEIEPEKNNELPSGEKKSDSPGIEPVS